MQLQTGQLIEIDPHICTEGEECMVTFWTAAYRSSCILYPCFGGCLLNNGTLERYASAQKSSGSRRGPWTADAPSCDHPEDHSQLLVQILGFQVSGKMTGSRFFILFSLLCSSWCATASICGLLQQKVVWTSAENNLFILWKVLSSLAGFKTFISDRSFSPEVRVKCSDAITEKFLVAVSSLIAFVFSKTTFQEKLVQMKVTVWEW